MGICSCLSRISRGVAIALCGLVATPLASYGQVWERLPQASPRVGAVALTSSLSEGRATPFAVATMGESLHLSLDLLGEESPRLYYRLERREADWSPSQLPLVEYLSGFESGEIPLGQMSRATLQPYTHYDWAFSISDLGLTLAGNYLLSIYEYGGDDHSLLCLPFALLSRQIEVHGSELRDLPIEKQDGYQGLEIQLAAGSRVGATLGLKPEELRVYVAQNYRWDNVQRLGDIFSRGGHGLSYTAQQAPIFEGGNEYHCLEHKDSRGGGLGIDRLTYDGGQYLLHAIPQHSRVGKSYAYKEDHNGLELVVGEQLAGDADYHLVNLSFVAPKIEGGRVVVEGAAFDYLPLEHRVARYDEQGARYEVTLPLKMGYQEYQFLYLPNGSGVMSSFPMEGSHSCATNSYTIYVYRRLPSERSDRLVGWQYIDLKPVH